MQWVVLPAVPAAWLLFGVLLCLATVVTKNVIQPPLYSHRPIQVFSCEFLRWWLVQRLISVTNVMFADQLRGTAYLTWWFRALVSFDGPAAMSKLPVEASQSVISITKLIIADQLWNTVCLAWWFRALARFAVLLSLSDVLDKVPGIT